MRVLPKMFFQNSAFLENLTLKSLFWRLAPNTIKTKAKWSHTGPKSAKVRFRIQKCFLGPKMHCGAKMHFWRQKWFSGGRCDFKPKGPLGDFTNSHTGYLFGHLATKIPKNAIFGPEMHSFSKILHFRSFCDFGPKRASFAKKCTFAPPCRGCL